MFDIFVHNLLRILPTCCFMSCFMSFSTTCFILISMSRFTPSSTCCSTRRTLYLVQRVPPHVSFNVLLHILLHVLLQILLHNLFHILFHVFLHVLLHASSGLASCLSPGPMSCSFFCMSSFISYSMFCLRS